MSYTTPMVIEANGEILALDDLRNSHGFGPFVWNAAAAKYLGDEFGWSRRSEELWPLWKDPRLPRAWRAALLVTYDFSIVERARAKEIAGLLREFVISVGTRDRVCHLPAVADLLDALPGDAIGMCFHGTSITEDWWHPWDDEKEESTTYDLKTETRHFFVGASLDESDRLARSPQQPAPSDTEGR
jgi:hypothetical protein